MGDRAGEHRPNISLRDGRYPSTTALRSASSNIPLSTAAFGQSKFGTLRMPRGPRLRRKRFYGRQKTMPLKETRWNGENLDLPQRPTLLRQSLLQPLYLRLAIDAVPLIGARVGGGKGMDAPD